MSETEANRAYRLLRQEIIRTELPPGSAIVESELCPRLGIGRTPVRDALQRLSHDGLVEIWPRRGTFVTQVTLSDLQQIFEVRVGLEQLVAELATLRHGPNHLRRLQLLARKSESLTGAESDVELDQSFHDLLLEMTGNSYLQRAYRQMADSSLRLLYMTRCGMEAPDIQRRTLRLASAALDRGDRLALATILVQHVREFRDRVAAAVFATSERDAR
ncbi:MAG: GntR family transcriptional regulator [Candidatus Dormiibacterota bacterium]